MKRRLAILAVLVVLAPVVPALTEQAQAEPEFSGVDLHSVTTYYIHPETGGVHVVADYEVINNDPATASGRWYYDGFTVPAPVDAINLTATGSVWPVKRREVAGNQRFVALDVSTYPIFFHASRTVTVTYDLTGVPPRTAENVSRLNPAYTGFLAYGVGEPGFVSVRVSVPDNYAIQPLGPDWAESREGDTTIYAIDVADPDAFGQVIAARNDDELVTDHVTTENGDEFDVRSWPGDTEWSDFVQSQISNGVPALEQLIGQDWPIDQPVDVHEAFTPYLYGYAGWFSASDNEIEIGERLDQEVVLHELSHAWFNNDWFKERWLSEGFAQEYSNLAVGELDGSPFLPDPVSPTDPGAITLNDWSDPDFSTTGTDDRERYGYNASYSVVKKIVDEIGVEKMQEVLRLVESGEIVYVGDGTPEDLNLVTDWKRFLDLVEIVGGSEDAAALLEKYVIPGRDKHLLDDRTAARDQYFALDEHGGEWAAPLTVRRAMGSWSFTKATTLMDDAEAILVMRDQLDALVAEAEATYPAELEAGYESARVSLDDTEAAVQAQLDAAQVLLDAVHAEGGSHGVFGTIGLIGTDLQGMLDEARAAFAAGDLDTAHAMSQKVIDAVDEETNKGLVRVGLAVGALLLILLTVLLIRRLRRRAAARRLAAAEAETAAPAAADAAATEPSFDEEGNPMPETPMPDTPMPDTPMTDTPEPDTP